MSQWESAERWGEPIAPGQADDPEDAGPLEAIECFCGTEWYPELVDSCPSCGREEWEQYLSDEEIEE